MNDKEMTNMISAELYALTKFVDEIIEGTIPTAPRPRMRYFILSARPLMVWPGDTIRLVKGEDGSYIIDSYDDAKSIAKHLEHNEKKVKFFVSQVRAASRWCKLRADGMRRHSETIKNQQQAGTVLTLKTETFLAKILMASKDIS